MLFKNVASQKALVFAYLKTTGVAQTGDASNITASVSKDGAASSASNDTNPTEIGGGWYAFDLTQAETNCDLFLLYAASSTGSVLVNGVAGYTTGGSIPQAGVASAANLATVDDFVDTEVAAIQTDITTLLGRVTNTRAGYLDNLNGHVAQTGDAYARLGAPAGASISADIATVDTVVDAIKAKTDNLPSDPADASVVAGLISAVETKVDTIDDFLDSEIAAIKAKTDNLPADPADASDIASSFLTVNGKLDVLDDFLDTEIAAIKAKTDNLPASPAAVGSAMTLAADSVNASALAADAVAEIQSGMSGIDASDVLEQVNAALDAASTELTTVPTTTGSLRQFVQFLHAYFRNLRTVTSTTETLKREDGTTTLGTATVSDNGTTFTKGELN